MTVEPRFKYVNKKCAEMFGYSTEEMKRQSIQSIVYPDDVNKVMKYHKNRTLGKKAPSRYEFRGIRKDGSIIYLEVDAVSLKEKGEIIGSRSYIWDNTQHKKLEEGLRKSEERYRNTLDNMLEGCQIIGFDWRYLYVNDAVARHGRTTKNKLLGKTMMEMYPGIEKTKMFSVLQRCMVKRTSSYLENEFEFPDGEKGWFELSIYPVPEGLAILSYEITKRKLVEKEIQQSMAKLRKLLRGTINAIASVVEARDTYTSGHQRRVADLARAIATEMGISKDQIEGIRSAGIIHDIGKICIPGEFLSKPTRLTESEFSFIKAHPQVAYDILKEIEFPWPIAQIIYQHHERMNGSGYPLGLSGDKILLEAKILTVADVVEAMSSHRPYRPAFAINEALKEISKNKGILYDARVVDTCLRLFKEKRFKLFV